MPIVAVNIWYHVGSKNERPGMTGFAHLFEHLMFEGSEHHNRGYFPPLQQAGALLNGSTNTDRTNYWEVVPTSAVDLALWMESDRMGYLLPALTRERFETQRDVVLNERRQNYENRPYGLAFMAITSALFPPDHPYHWMTIGDVDDLRAMQFEDVQEFFRTYYHPSNASLAIAGDIETERAFELAEHYFGELAPGIRAARRSRAAAVALRREAARARGPRRDAAYLHGVAFAGDVRAGRCRDGPDRRTADEREDVAAVSLARVREADRARRVCVPELARAWQLLPARRDGRARPLADRHYCVGGQRAAAAQSTRVRPTARWSA